jgi:hypothetical protein
MDGSQCSKRGGIQVRTTERGLPLAIKLDERELSRPPLELAQDILALCQLSGLRLQVARRDALVARGTTAAVLQGLSLGTAEDVRQAEARLSHAEDDADPDTWMSPL